MIIDVHTHTDLGKGAIIPKDYRPKREATKKRIQKIYGFSDIDEFHLYLMEKSRIDKAVILALDARPYLYYPNEHVLKLANDYDVFIPFISINPNRTGYLEILENGISKGARGLKFLPPVQHFNPSEIDERIYKMAVENKLVLLTHTGPEPLFSNVEDTLGDPKLLKPILKNTPI